MTLIIEHILPSDEELENGLARREPSRNEQFKHLMKILRDAGALNPDALAAEMFSTTSYGRGALLIEDEVAQKVIRRLAEREPHLFKPSRHAKIDALRDHWRNAHLQSQGVC